MSERNEIFADGISSVHFYKGTVRFDLVSLEPSEDGKPEIVNQKDRIIMPPNGLLSVYNALQNLVNQLVDAKVLKKNEPKSAE